MYNEGQKIEKEFAIVIDLRLTLLTVLVFRLCMHFSPRPYISRLVRSDVVILITRAFKLFLSNE